VIPLSLNLGYPLLDKALSPLSTLCNITQKGTELVRLCTGLPAVRRWDSISQFFFLLLGLSFLLFLFRNKDGQIKEARSE
jgi:hypothetical protein